MKRRRDGRLSPPQMLIVTFLSLIGFGTLGLRWLPGLYEGERLSWLDCLFTSTSAVCVTGLVVVDVATFFTPFGQGFILLLIQLGGLGILGLASLIIVTLNRRLSLRQDVLAGGGDVTPAAGHVPIRSLVRDVAMFTFACEGAGFLLLWGLWALDPPRPGLSQGQVAWHAMFHGVNAFCGAGFSTFSEGMTLFRERPLTQAVVMGGIVLGGLGFLTLEELKLWAQARRQRRAFRLSLHTRLVLATTAALIVVGWVAIGAMEWANPQTLGPLGMPDKLVNALFCSVTPRTAGYATIDYGQTLPGTNFLTILLMSIGGAPGSMAGGVKVTTVGILAAMAYARFRGRRSNDLWGRTIPATTAQRAVGLFAFAFVIVTLGIGLLTVTELGTGFQPPAIVPSTPLTAAAAPPGSAATVAAARHDFLDHMFEAVSAFNTVGLSTGPSGTSPTLSAAGRFLIALLMFVGRVGPLTVAAALSRDEPQQRLIRRYAQEDVVVG